MNREYLLVLSEEFFNRDVFKSSLLYCYNKELLWVNKVNFKKFVKLLRLFNPLNFKLLILSFNQRQKQTPLASF